MPIDKQVGKAGGTVIVTKSNALIINYPNVKLPSLSS